MQFNTDVMVKDENIKIPLEKKKIRRPRAKGQEIQISETFKN